MCFPGPHHYTLGHLLWPSPPLESKSTRIHRVLPSRSNKLLRAHFVRRGLELYLEHTERLGAIDLFGLRFTVNDVGNNESRRPCYAGRLPILKVLLNPILVFTAVIATVELVHIQTINRLGDRGNTLVGEGTSILTKNVSK